MTDAEQTTETTAAPEATTAPITEPVVETPQDGAEQQTEQQQPESFDRAYVEQLRRENANYRTKAKEEQAAKEAAAEAARRKNLTAEQRATEAEQKAQAATEAAEARVQAAERKASLAGVVTHPDRVLKLMDDPAKYFAEDGTIKQDDLLRDFPEYAPTANTPQGKTPVGGAGGNNPKPMSLSDVGQLTPAEYEARRAEIFAQLKKS